MPVQVYIKRGRVCEEGMDRARKMRERWGRDEWQVSSDPDLLQARRDRLHTLRIMIPAVNDGATLHVLSSPTPDGATSHVPCPL